MTLERSQGLSHTDTGSPGMKATDRCSKFQVLLTLPKILSSESLSPGDIWSGLHTILCRSQHLLSCSTDVIFPDSSTVPHFHHTMVGSSLLSYALSQESRKMQFATSSSALKFGVMPSLWAVVSLQNFLMIQCSSSLVSLCKVDYFSVFSPVLEGLNCCGSLLHFVQF